MNYLTEDEARTLDCPFFRSCVNEHAVRYGSADAFYQHSKCRASECIAWRWKHMGGDHNQIGEPIDPVPAQGYCGLAGKP